ncbi:6417_t:CDS:10 [Funneliformis geosporum]|uniref:4347_t:CDS:1 n=1 Tax=Funneliformis geosporum TaxID=1117311 RepID=A0A9W4WV55_9GLOM|nr:4347_t:CDS:10 [Funneliformis geosporum]CAI2188183.1 6417_t:CDS:10 [Funneliformis geosporum]
MVCHDELAFSSSNDDKSSHRQMAGMNELSKVHLPRELSPNGRHKGLCHFLHRKAKRPSPNGRHGIAWKMQINIFDDKSAHRQMAGMSELSKVHLPRDLSPNGRHKELCFWSLRHYIDWICKNEKELPQWETCLDNFYNSLDFVNSRRGVSIYIRTCARRNLDNKELPEIEAIMKELQEPYERVYNGKYGGSMYKTAVQVQKEEEVFALENEKTLKEEIKLPLASGISSKDPLKHKLSSDIDVSEAFHSYQAKIPKCRKVSTPAYWGILDLTNESLHGCKYFTEIDMKELNQEFSNCIGWIDTPAEESLQQYFDNNCQRNYDKKFEKLDANIQFIKNNMCSFQGTLTEEELKMSSSFPLFRGIFTSDHIKDVWGETQALATNDARNEKQNPFQRARIGRKVDMKCVLVKTLNKFEVVYGEVSGGLGPFGPSAHRKKRFLDKVKLMVTMRDSLNNLLKKYKHTSDKQRMDIIVYGWLQVGMELSFYALDWIGDGVYRFGLLDQCIIPSDKNDCNMIEDAYCVIKTLEIKLLQTETAVRNLLSNNTKGKRRRTATENEPKLNLNRTPIKQK